MGNSPTENSDLGMPPINPMHAHGARTAAPFVTVTYEERLNHDARWALSEGSRHFEENSSVFNALHNIAARLKALGIDYAIVGGMALFRHGFRRFTEDVDILVRRDDLKTIHEKLEGLGYVRPFSKSKHLRDTRTGVKIEFLTTGDYPGDGKEKPVAFPDPKSVATEIDGVSYLSLPALVELKLASGMTGKGRASDLADVLRLITIRDLPQNFADQLNSYVRDKFVELWNEGRKRFVRTVHVSKLPEIGTAEQLQADGIAFENVRDNVIRLVTYDVLIAEKYGLLDESEYWEDADTDVSDTKPPQPNPPAS